MNREDQGISIVFLHSCRIEIVLCGPVRIGPVVPIDMMIVMFTLIMMLCFLQPDVLAADSRSPDALATSLSRSAGNRDELERAIEAVPEDHRADLIWMIERMPLSDLQSMTSNQLIRNVSLAREAHEASPWGKRIPLDIYRDAILPYACINEKRDDWRAGFLKRFSPMVSEARTTSEAAAILNNTIFKTLGVVYSTQRPRADQSPLESIDAGMASCTGLSILLVDACRSVGIPARFVGTPLWSDGSGNHSWVEIYDSGQWHFTGAAEPVGEDLDKAWFAARASTAIEGHPQHAILAVTWRQVPLHFPLPWSSEDRSIRAVDVTSRYSSVAQEVPEGMKQVRFVAIDHDGTRRSVAIRVTMPGSEKFLAGTTRDERFDTNDHLEMILPAESSIQVTAMWPSGQLVETHGLEGDQPLITLHPAPVEIRPSDPE